MKTTIFIVLLALLLTACSQSIPEDKSDYIGVWQKEGEATLVILADGLCTYRHSKDSQNISVSGPIKEFDGNDFIVGILSNSKRFTVTEPPNNDNGSWQMVVEGIRFTKVK